MHAGQVSIICMTVFVVVVLTGCDNAPKEPGRYYDRGKHFSIRFPDGWNEQKPDAGVTVKVANPENTAQIGVQIQKVAPQKTLVDVVNYMRSFIQSQGGQVVGDGQSVINNYDAYWLMSRLKQEIILSYYLKKEDQIYAVLITSSADTFSNDFEDNMRQVAESFQFE